MGNLGRHLKEGSKNLLRNKWLTVVSLLSVMVTLFIVGVFTLIIMNVNHMTKNIESNVEAIVYLDLDIDSKRINGIAKELEDIKYVKSVEFIDKKQGLENLINDLGEYGIAFDNLKNDNPLNDSFVIKPNSPEEIEKLTKELEKIKNIERVEYGKNVVDTLLKVTNMIRNVGLVLIIGLIITALLLISNTIKNSIEVRREEIKIMRLVGAKNSFIKAPYIVEGLILGLVGSFVPLIVILLSYSFILKAYINTVDVKFMELLNLSDVYIVITLIVVGLSVVIGTLGSSISIKKHLKK